MLNTITIALLMATSVLIILAKLTEPGIALAVHKNDIDYCENCGEKLYPKQKYCSECGSELVWGDNENV